MLYTLDFVAPQKTLKALAVQEAHKRILQFAVSAFRILKLRDGIAPLIDVRVPTRNPSGPDVSVVDFIVKHARLPFRREFELMLARNTKNTMLFLARPENAARREREAAAAAYTHSDTEYQSKSDREIIGNTAPVQVREQPLKSYGDVVLMMMTFLLNRSVASGLYKHRTMLFVSDSPVNFMARNLLLTADNPTAAAPRRGPKHAGELFMNVCLHGDENAQNMWFE